MNIIEKIIFINKVRKKVKEAKKLIDKNQGLATRVLNTIEMIQTNMRSLIYLLPMLKDVEKEFIEFLKEK